MNHLIRLEKSGDLTLELQGELTGPWAIQELGEALQEAEPQVTGQLILNMEKVLGINSSCLGKLFQAQKALKLKSKNLKIRGCSPEVYNTFILVRADMILDIEKSSV